MNKPQNEIIQNRQTFADLESQVARNQHLPGKMGSTGLSDPAIGESEVACSAR